ncbi:MAG: type II secretion system F family protein [Candidatus Eremiobacteraeota bacterium]|nr:type II secretion system F family protein [Candidatus Eremiobacteraeota bacterium]
MAMKKFKYSGIDSNGENTTGTIDASNRDEALTILARRNLIIKSVKEAGDAEEEVKPFKLNIPELLHRKVGYEDLANFAFEGASLIDSGVSLPKTLELLIKGEKNPTMKETLKDVLRTVRAGSPLSKAVADHPDVFPPLFSALIRSGEGSGTLEKSLMQLSDYFDNLNSIRNRIISALAYPVVVVIFAFLIFTGLFLFVAPKFVKVYSELGVAVPFSTRILLDMGKYSDDVFFGVLISLVVIIPLLIAYSRTENGSMAIDKLKLQFPVLGPIFEQVAINNFVKTMAILIRSGINLRTSVELAAHVTGNRYLIKRILVMEKPLTEGKQLSEALRYTNLLGDEVLGMLEAGEKSGKLGDMLEKVANFTGNKMQREVERIMAMVEPLLIGMIGIVLGAAMIMLAGPLFNLPSEINP